MSTMTEYRRRSRLHLSAKLWTLRPRRKATYPLTQLLDKMRRERAYDEILGSASSWKITCLQCARDISRACDVNLLKPLWIYKEEIREYAIAKAKERNLYEIPLMKILKFEIYRCIRHALLIKRSVISLKGKKSAWIDIYILVSIKPS